MKREHEDYLRDMLVNAELADETSRKTMALFRRTQLILYPR